MTQRVINQVIINQSRSTLEITTSPAELSFFCLRKIKKSQSNIEKKSSDAMDDYDGVTQLLLLPKVTQQL